jgi:hypothetical protein
MACTSSVIDIEVDWQNLAALAAHGAEDLGLEVDHRQVQGEQFRQP